MLLPLLALSATVGAAPDVAACFEGVAAAPHQLARYRCFKTVDEGRADDHVLHAVRDALDREVENPWLRYVLGVLLQRRGDAQADQLFLDAAQGLARLGYPGDAARVHAAIAAAALSHEHPEQARRHAALARHLADRSEDHRATLAVNALDAAIALDLDDAVRRARSLAQAVLADPAAGPDLQMNALSILATVANRSDRPREAAEHLWRLAEIARVDGARADEARSRLLALLLARTRHAGRDAIATPSELEATLSLAQTLAKPELELFVRGELIRADSVHDADVQREACSLLAAGTTFSHGQRQCEEAWAYARARDNPFEAQAIAYRLLDDAAVSGATWRVLHARLLLARLAWAGRSTDVAIEVSIDLLHEVETLRRAQADHEERRATSAWWSPAYATVIDGLLEAGQVKLALTAVEHHRDPERTWDDATATVDDFWSNRPDPSVALAAFAQGAGKTWLIVVGAADATACVLPAREQLAPAMRVFTGLAAHRSDLSGPDVELYQRLLGCASPMLEPATTWLVLPDGELHHTPLAALRAPGHATAVGLQHAIVRVPSIAAWQHGHAPRPTDGAAAIADPMDAQTLDGARVSALPHARVEAMVAAHGGPVLSAERATEAGFRRLSASAPAVLHIATHAVQIDTESRAAALSLAPEGDDDGLLRAAEIAATDLRGSVVVLSACSSGADPLVSGPGLAGLSAAFIEAGATAVVAILWPIRDDDALAFFRAFYARLHAGATVAEAVLAARTARQRAGAPAQAWAGFVVLGRGDVRRPGPPARSPRRPLGPGWLLVTTIAAMRMRVKRSKADPPPSTCVDSAHPDVKEGDGSAEGRVRVLPDDGRGDGRVRGG